jgi:phenylalanyl-tRNA synthetase alpha chain
MNLAWGYTVKTMEERQKGHLHPLSQTASLAARILGDLGFVTASGPEIEDEYYNFDALNVPKDHPARDMQDTFWLKGEPGKVLRTHTSPVQIRYMESHQPPIRIVVPGKVFRNEATDATHEAQFFQIEGLAVDSNISLAHLKGTLEYFFKKLFGEETKIRFRPTYFPFVEPGLEVDVWFRGKWLEVLGAGMVHPNVLSNAGINPRKFSGFAFGGGVDRLAMIRYQVPDVRLFYQGDMRFLSQF